jgi:signal peptidase I
MKKLLTVLCCAFAILIIALRVFFFGLSVIPQNGMYPNLPAGTHVITLRHPYRAAGEVRRGDVVAVIQNINGVEYKFIWRVVALPGEQVETKSGHLIVNESPATYDPLPQSGTTGSVLREKSAGVAYSVAFLPASKPIADISYRVPANSFFLLGDNRNNAADSRVYGVVPLSAIVGKVVFSW